VDRGISQMPRPRQRNVEMGREVGCHRSLIEVLSLELTWGSLKNLYVYWESSTPEQRGCGVYYPSNNFCSRSDNHKTHAATEASLSLIGYS
jgi:hypothetical protein